jgi:hypothetical protein
MEQELCPPDNKARISAIGPFCLTASSGKNDAECMVKKQGKAESGALNWIR